MFASIHGCFCAGLHSPRHARCCNQPAWVLSGATWLFLQGTEPWILNRPLPSTFYKNYNRFWVIENSKPIIEKLEKINSSRTGAKDISTYDFSTLYTKLPHDDIIKNLSEIVDFAFNGGNVKKDGNRRFLTVKGKSAFWTRKRHGKNSFSKEKIKQLTTHLIKGT